MPTGIPLVYQLDKDLKPMGSDRAVAPLTGYFLGDAAAVAASQKAVAEQSAVRYGEKERTEAEVEFVSVCIGDGCLMLSDDDMRQTFDEFDEDGNGFISASELQRAIARLADDGEAVSADEVDAMIRTVDRNGDGQIDFGEFVQALTLEKEVAA